MNEFESKPTSGLQEYLFKIMVKGRYSFTLDELKSSLPISEKAISQSLFRLKTKGQVAQVRQGFYVIVPPEYSASGMLPSSFFMDQMMKWLGRRYYFGLFSAAAIHGSSHQQPMESFIVTRPPALRKTSQKNLVINYLLKGSWEESDIVQKKSASGYINVSSPELTALDLLLYNNWVGLNRAIEIITDLALDMRPSVLAQTARRFPVTSTIQRLGYILDQELGNEKLASTVNKVLDDRIFHVIPLSISNEQKGRVSLRWKININMEVDTD